MRTTLALDDDVIDKAKSVAAARCTSFRAIINEALRIGLEAVEKPAQHRPYQTTPHAMGLRPGCNLDNIQELLTQVEGESFK